MTVPLRVNVPDNDCRQTFVQIKKYLDRNSILKNNFTATTNPTVNDDSGDGYEAGSIWINVTLNRVYILELATLGAANWILLAPEGGAAAADATYITQTPSGDLGSEQALSLLTTGILKSTTGTGVVSIAAAGTDYSAPGHTHTLADITDEGTMAAQNANNVAITGGSITGITDLAVADGGTGASTPAQARINLGVVLMESRISLFSSGMPIAIL